MPTRRVALRRFSSRTARTLAGVCDFQPVLEPALRARCRQFTSRAPFDAVLLSSLLLRPLWLPPGVPIVADTHNVEFDVLRRAAALSDRFLVRQYARLQWRAMRRQERRCARRVNFLLATSDRDRQVFEEELGVDNVAVVPNGIDLAEFHPSAAAPIAKTIVFSGLMSYYPNQQAIRWFLDDILPLVRQQIADVHVIVAGASPPQWLTARAGPHVEITGWVPDIRPHLERASVVIAPLRIGGGTRVKILEAQAMRRPVVSTTLGAEGLGACHGVSIMLADDAESFAARVIELLADAGLAARIAAQGRKRVVRHFDCNRIGDGLRVLLEARVGLGTCTELRGWPGQPPSAEQIA